MRRPTDTAATAEVTARFLTAYANATPEQIDSGRLWYLRARSACGRLAERHGFDLLGTVKAAAVLSSNVGWDRNLELLDSLLAVPGDNPGTFGRVYRQALDSLLDGAAVTGPKRNPFASAILGIGDSAVVDRHILRAAGYPRKSTPRRMRICAAALRAAAGSLRVPVTTLQATVWLVERDENV